MERKEDDRTAISVCTDSEEEQKGEPEHADCCPVYEGSKQASDKYF
jgi:hypothetical protein